MIEIDVYKYFTSSLRYYLLQNYLQNVQKQRYKYKYIYISTLTITQTQTGKFVSTYR